MNKEITELTGCTTEEQLIKYIKASKEYALIGEKVKNSIDYSSICNDLEEFFIKEDHYNLGWSFSYSFNISWTSISFNEQILWDTEQERYNRKNDCEWETETLLEYCKDKFIEYVNNLKEMIDDNRGNN